MNVDIRSDNRSIWLVVSVVSGDVSGDVLGVVSGDVSGDVSCLCAGEEDEASLSSLLLLQVCSRCQVTWWAPPSLRPLTWASACLLLLLTVTTPPSPSSSTLPAWTLWRAPGPRCCPTCPPSTTTDTSACTSVPLSRRSSRRGTSASVRGSGVWTRATPNWGSTCRDRVPTNVSARWRRWGPPSGTSSTCRAWWRRTTSDSTHLLDQTVDDSRRDKHVQHPAGLELRKSYTKRIYNTDNKHQLRLSIISIWIKFNYYN